MSLCCHAQSPAREVGTSVQVDREHLQPLSFGSHQHGGCHILMPLFCELPFLSRKYSCTSCSPSLLTRLPGLVRHADFSLKTTAPDGEETPCSNMLLWAAGRVTGLQKRASYERNVRVRTTAITHDMEDCACSVHELEGRGAGQRRAEGGVVQRQRAEAAGDAAGGSADD